MLLLLLAAFFASGALLTKFNLEALGATLEDQLAEHVGAEVQLGGVNVDGFRGFVIDDLDVALDTEGGPQAHIVTPRARVHIRLVELLYGRLRVDRIELHGTTVQVVRPDEAAWYDPAGFDLRELFDFPESHGFRVTGEGCSLEVHNIVGDTRARIDNIAFDIARLSGAPDLTANITGDLEGAPDKGINVRLSMATFDDFDLRVKHGSLTADDINIFLPARHRFVQSGTVAPTFRVSASPEEPLRVSIDGPFTDIVLRDQPEFLKPATGRLTAHATYAPDTQEFTVTAAKAVSDELSGTLEGVIGFDAMYPEFDLRLEATKLPVQQLLDHWGLEGRIEDYGATELTLGEPSSVVVALRGNSDAPEFTGEVYAASGTFVFAPASPSDTNVRLELGAVEAVWNSETETLTGELTVLDGRIENTTTGLTATETRGTVRIEENRIVADPVRAMVTGMPFSARVEYEIDSHNMDAEFSGVLAHLEETVAYDMIRRTLVSGDLAIRQATVTKRGDRYQIDADIDASQLRVDHNWWYTKQAGVGATGTVSIDAVPSKSLDISAKGEVASSHFDADVSLVYSDREEHPWRLERATATSDHIDIAGLSQCIKVPYRISGGTGTDGQYLWERNQAYADGWRQVASATIDALDLLPLAEGAVTPMSFSELRVESETIRTDEDTATIDLKAKSARMPNLNEPWLLPLDMTPPEGIQREESRRDWTYHLAAQDVLIPPWDGTDFRATAYSTPGRAGFEHYEATVGDGVISGTYNLGREDNFYTSSVAWDGVPAATLIEHLGFPEVLTGALSGGIEYRMDRDDPNTLQGEGQFTIVDGQFSADYVASLLQGQTEGELSALPPSLRFSEFTGEVVLDKDIIGTPSFALTSEDIRVEGNGHYVREGDMDYQIKVAIAPSAAERIPALRENLNLKGYRVANQDVELAFRVAGPTFNPKGRVEEMPPVGVTLVSGITEVTSSVIDFPRKILVDLLKMGGGMLGASN